MKPSVPPLHNIPPPRTPLGTELRRLLRRQAVFVDYDYSTVELRILMRLRRQLKGL